MTTSPDRDRDLLFKIIESLAETKAMLKSALERADKADGQIEALRNRVDAIERHEANLRGRAGLLGTIFGSLGGGVVTLAVMFAREKLGF